MNSDSSRDESGHQREFDELVKAADPQAYSKLPIELRHQLVRMIGRVALQVTEFSGPLPPPEQLAKYEQVLQGAAERIISMAEHQSTHRTDLGKKVVTEQLSQSARGQVLAFIVAILFLIGALTSTILGHDAVGGALGTTTVLGLVATFIAGRKSQHESLRKKQPGDENLAQRS